jgi:hypothetical protein
MIAPCADPIAFERSSPTISATCPRPNANRSRLEPLPQQALYSSSHVSGEAMFWTGNRTRWVAPEPGWLAP